jgi:hypothetical protein
MQTTDPTKYTKVTQEQFDRFKTLAKAKGANISGNKDDVTFDLIPLRVEYKPDTQELQFTTNDPFWMPSGLTAGMLHTMIAQAMAEPERIPPAAEANVATHKTGTFHPASVSRPSART